MPTEKMKVYKRQGSNNWVFSCKEHGTATFTPQGFEDAWHVLDTHVEFYHCSCHVVENPWTFNGIVEPGGAMEPDPECPVHFPNGPLTYEDQVDLIGELF